MATEAENCYRAVMDKDKDGNECGDPYVFETSQQGRGPCLLPLLTTHFHPEGSAHLFKRNKQNNMCSCSRFDHCFLK